jgi:hypothetical protein
MGEPWQATLSGLAMDGTPDESGCVWGIEEIVGWDSPDMVSQRANRTSGNGSFGPQARRGGREMTVSGWAECPSMQAAFAARDRLPSLTDGELVRVEDVSKRLTVTHSGQIRATDPIDGAATAIFKFQISVVAHYPFKRALAATTVAVGAGATVSHTAAGTFPAEIEVTLTSGGTVDLTIAGLRLRTGSLPSGAVLTSGPGFTRPKRTIRSSSGGNLFGSIVQPMQWPAMVPGANSIHQAGTAGLSIRYFPTYA